GGATHQFRFEIGGEPAAVNRDRSRSCSFRLFQGRSGRLNAMLHALVVLLAALALAAQPCSADTADTSSADLVLLGGTIVTVETGGRRIQALAARGERIVALGTDADMKSLVGPQTRVIELAGRLAIPGFIEGHGHLASLGEARLNLDVTGARDWN